MPSSMYYHWPGAAGSDSMSCEKTCMNPWRTVSDGKHGPQPCWCIVPWTQFSDLPKLNWYIPISQECLGASYDKHFKHAPFALRIGHFTDIFEYIWQFDLQHEGSMDPKQEFTSFQDVGFNFCQFVWGISGTLERLDLWVQRVGELVTEKLLYGRSSARMAVAFCCLMILMGIFLFQTLVFGLWSEDVWLSSSGWTNSFWTQIWSTFDSVSPCCVLGSWMLQHPKRQRMAPLKPKVRQCKNIKALKASL